MQQEIERLIHNIEQVIIGKREVITKVIAALIAGGHILIEDVPGVGKTQMVAALARSVNGKFNRIQMTPDVMPSDIIGYAMIQPDTKKITYQKGAAICNFLLVDEINRASPKAQSSLLEIMEEQQISIEGQTFDLPKPFMTLATQNPIETYGTYHLPEAQMDRFFMRLTMGYPNKSEEMTILDNVSGENPAKQLAPVLSTEGIVAIQQAVGQITIHQLVKEYILEIVHATRNSEYIHLGISPRGGLALQRGARAMAFIQQRNYVVPDDVRYLASAILAHRLILSPKGKSSFGTQAKVIEQIIAALPVPSPQ